jgi:tRNA(fMet)-specific endonuclease VapC
VRFLLDTDAVSHALRNEGKVAARLRECPPSMVAVSAITAADLSYGVARSRTRRIARVVGTFLEAVAIVPFDAAAATAYGRLAARLVEAGVPIGHMDTLIAAHGLALHATVVTHNTRHFSRVPGLRVVDWY